MEPFEYATWEEGLASLRRMFPEAEDLLQSRSAMNPDPMHEVVLAQGLNAEWDSWSEDTWPSDDVEGLKCLVGDPSVFTGDVYAVTGTTYRRSLPGPYRIPGPALREFVDQFGDRFNSSFFDGGDIIIWCEQPPRLAICNHDYYVLNLDLEKAEPRPPVDTEAVLQALEQRAIALDEAEAAAPHAAARGAVAEVRVELLRSLGRAGIFGARPRPSVLPWKREQLEARLMKPGLPVLAGYFFAAQALRGYYESPVRGGAAVPEPVWGGPISLDWFRNESPRPAGTSLFGWTEFCERGLPSSIFAETIVGQAGEYFRLRVRSEPPAVWNALSKDEWHIVLVSAERV